MIQFRDSVSPGSIPTATTHVAAYATGRYVWPTEQLDRFERHIKIGVLSRSPSQARIARVLDIERFDASVDDFPPFAEERLDLKHPDPTAYCSIDTIPALLLAIEAARLYTWRLWVAWWWERPLPPTAAEVLAEIRALTGIELPPRVLWACQWQNGVSYDTSVLYGADDFTRR